MLLTSPKHSTRAGFQIPGPLRFAISLVPRARMPTGRYEKLKSLGQNEYVTVYRGWDIESRHPVAIMELQERFRSNPEKFEVIWAAVTDRQGVTHPGLVPAENLDKDCAWIISPLMKGSLADEIAEKPLAPDLVRGYLRAALEALAHLHDHELVHGDVRPKNLLLDQDGHLRLSFSPGLELAGEVPQRRANAKYLAPELLEAGFGTSGKATDLYCLGFSAYELLLGPSFNRLFRGIRADAPAGELERAWMLWHGSNERLAPLGRALPSVPSDLSDLIDRLVEKHVSDRPANAREALDLLTPSTPPDFELSEQSDDDMADDKKRAGGKPSKSFLERITEDRRVFYPVVAGVLLIAALIILYLPGGSNKPPLTTPDPAPITNDSQGLKTSLEEMHKRIGSLTRRRDQAHRRPETRE
jgi:serine/threonine protein kinase